MLEQIFMRSESPAPPLRIGLLLDTAHLPACFAAVVDHILRSNFAHLELVIFNAEEEQQPAKEAQPVPQRSALAKVADTLRDSQRRKTFLYDLLERFDARNIVPAEYPLAMVDCAAKFAGVESMSVVPLRKRFVHRFPPKALETIRAKKLDVLIRFGFNILRGEILTAAQYGVWSYHHGDGDYYRGGPAYFWELREGNAISGAMLQVLTEELDAGKVLCKGYFGTYPGISRARNCTQPYWGSSTFMIQKLRELHQYGWDYVSRKALSPTPYKGKKKIYTKPSNVEMVSWLGPLFARKLVQRLVRRPQVKHWRLAIRTGARPIRDFASEPDMSGFRWIESPRGRFYADPHMLEEGGRQWVFFEDFDYATQRGRISCAEAKEGGLVNTMPAVERPYHLSYPCVFRDGNEIYMIPESRENGTVELYRCKRFPDQWELEKVLFRAQAVDTTLWVEDGVYWFFTTIVEPRGFGTQLWLFSADSLTGEWKPHPASPISTDARDSRGAGGIFRHNGKLYRPSQDCAEHYGYGFALNEITLWNRSEYKETTGVSIGPTWTPGLVGTHSYSFAGPVEVIDGCVALPTASVHD